MPMPLLMHASSYLFGVYANLTTMPCNPHLSCQACQTLPKTDEREEFGGLLWGHS